MIISFGVTNAANSQSVEELRSRRNDIRAKMEPGSIMIIRTPQLSGMFENGRYGGNFYYLTGIDESNCTLILFSNDFQFSSILPASSKEVLFIRPVNTGRINWDAQTIGIEGAITKYGIEDARPDSEASEFIGRLLASN